MGLYGLGCIPVYGPICYMGLYRPVHRPYIGDMGLSRYTPYIPYTPYLACIPAMGLYRHIQACI